MYNKYLDVDLKKQREEHLKSDVAKSLISEFIEIAEQAANKVYPAFSITDYMLYNKTAYLGGFPFMFPTRNTCPFFYQKVFGFEFVLPLRKNYSVLKNF